MHRSAPNTKLSSEDLTRAAAHCGTLQHTAAHCQVENNETEEDDIASLTEPVAPEPVAPEPVTPNQWHPNQWHPNQWHPNVTEPVAPECYEVGAEPVAPEPVAPECYEVR